MPKIGANFHCGQVELTSRRSEWHMPAHLVNTYHYDPQQNQIVFPAAILQAFLWPSPIVIQPATAESVRSLPNNLHAFDTNGASDEHGSLKDWWKPRRLRSAPLFTQMHRSIWARLLGAKINRSDRFWRSVTQTSVSDIMQPLKPAKRKGRFLSRRILHQHCCIWRMKARTECMQLASVDVRTRKTPRNVSTKLGQILWRTLMSRRRQHNTEDRCDYCETKIERSGFTENYCRKIGNQCRIPWMPIDLSFQRSSLDFS